MQRRLTPNRMLALVLLAAAGVAATLIAVSVTGWDGGGRPMPVTGAREAARLLAGIPQRGNALGDPRAPITLVEYAEPQCPFCGLWARSALPAIVRDYVRPGTVKIVFRGLVFLQPTTDSERALRAAVAAGQQGRLWHVLELLYRNQGEEGTGWISDDVLRALLTAVPGLDVERVLRQRDDNSVSQTLTAWAAQASRDGVGGTPTFLIGRSGGELRPLQVPSASALSDPAFFASAFDRLLQS